MFLIQQVNAEVIVYINFEELRLSFNLNLICSLTGHHTKMFQLSFLIQKQYYFFKLLLLQYISSHKCCCCIFGFNLKWYIAVFSPQQIHLIMDFQPTLMFTRVMMTLTLCQTPLIRHPKKLLFTFFLQAGGPHCDSMPCFLFTAAFQRVFRK